jgi:hypothetical protein
VKEDRVFVYFIFTLIEIMNSRTLLLVNYRGGKMKKEVLKYRFIEMRAMGYTYKKICTELKISNPTSIKWGRMLSEEINQQQKYLMSKIFAQRVVEQEQGILISLDQFRRSNKMNLPKRIRDRMDKRILKRLGRIFTKKISAIHLKVKDDNVISATLIFNDDLTVKTQ